MRFERDWKPVATGSDEVIYRPVLRAHLRLKDGRFREYEFIVDSGADVSMAPRQVAVRMGLPWQQSKPVVFGGISRKKVCEVQGRIFDVQILINGVPEPVGLPICFAEGSAPLLLGREGLFDRMRVEFDKCNRRTVFTLNE